MSMVSIILILFLIMDPVGNISSFNDLLKGMEPKKQRWIILREMGIAIFLMLAFYGIGDLLLDLLKVSETTVRLASGIILFLAAIKILFPGTKGFRENLKIKDEPFIVPLAIPLVAGPSLLATIMLYAHLDEIQLWLIPAIFIAWLLSTIILFFSGPIKSLLGANGLSACERLMGMVLILLAIQRFLEGVMLLVAGKGETGG